MKSWITGLFTVAFLLLVPALSHAGYGYGHFEEYVNCENEVFGQILNECQEAPQMKKEFDWDLGFMINNTFWKSPNKWVKLRNFNFYVPESKKGVSFIGLDFDWWGE